VLDLKAAGLAGYTVDNRLLITLYQEQAQILLQLSIEAQANGDHELTGLMITVAWDLRNDGLWKQLLPQLAEWVTRW
jgi:hypothetical protein